MKKARDWSVQFPKGELHPAYKNGNGKGHIARWSKKVREMVNECSLCGNVGGLEAHHVDGNARNNVVENIQVLCLSCHHKLHWKARHKYPEEAYISKKSYYKYVTKGKVRIEMEKKKKDMLDLFFSKFNTYKYYRAKGLAKIYGVTRQRINQLRDAGKFQYIKYGGQYLYCKKRFKA